MRHKLLLMVIGCLFTTAIKAQTTTYPPAKGHEDLPVIFWAHYMPMVSSGNIHCGGHVGGNYDAFPFQPQRPDRTQEMVEEMKIALASGINGLQFLRAQGRVAPPCHPV